MLVRLGYDRGRLTGPIVDGMCLRQSFTAESNFLIDVAICFATYRRKNSGRMFLTLKDHRGGTITTVSSHTSEFKDNAYHVFGIAEPLEEGKTYEIYLHTQNSRSGNAVTAKWGRKSKQGHFFIGARIQNGELAISFNYRDGQKKSEVVVVDKPVVALPAETSPGLVSIVIPHYNCPNLLRKCLESLVRQTYRCMQVIVVDDGSDNRDAVVTLLDAFSGLLTGIRLVDGKTNRGAPVARNMGAEAAQGEFLLFLDADCELYPDALEAFMNALMENPDKAYAYCGFKWGDETVRPKDFDPEALKTRNFVSTMSMMRRALFPGFDESLKRHQDWDLWLTMLLKGEHQGVCTKRLLFETPKRDGISNDENIPMMESIAIVRRKHGLA
jgi:hypothetical protein